MYGLPFRRNDYHLGSILYVENVQQVMLGETNTKVFTDVLLKKDLLLFLIMVLFFFWMYPKPITDLITPSLENILTHINRIN
jgi:NADH-quinone oxidoreductase subunit M